MYKNSESACWVISFEILKLDALSCLYDLFGCLGKESIREGFKNATIAAVVSAVPTLVAVRKIPWAKANLNYTAQALIISAASIAAFFITADKTTLECARRNALLEDALRRQR
ncbi:hypothetical protein RGQ29_009038 [Quercus rubra]|uniref:Early nodulin-93-like n=1 Tax=Quercus rubra TaxID=3512 RepID=A0AAN7I024_QUERU|nr:hypothetical protein RGQ29_009038 [Quercus rubra]